MNQRQPEVKGAPGKSLVALPPTRLTLIPEETREPQFTTMQREALGAVYELITEVARRVRDEGQVAA